MIIKLESKHYSYVENWERNFVKESYKQKNKLAYQVFGTIVRPWKVPRARELRVPVSRPPPPSPRGHPPPLPGHPPLAHRPPQQRSCRALQSRQGKKGACFKQALVLSFPMDVLQNFSRS